MNIHFSTNIAMHEMNAEIVSDSFIVNILVRQFPNWHEVEAIPGKDKIQCSYNN